MKNEKIKCYVGNYILPYGRPTVFNTGWETDTEFFCERFILFETLKNTVICSGMCTVIDIETYKFLKGINDNNAALEDFMDWFGKELSESEIFNIVSNLMGEEKYNEIIIKLFESQVVGNLYYIKKKYPDKLSWLKRNTVCNEFKKLIDLVSDLNLTVTEYK